MKRLLFLVLYFLPIAAVAQNVWERPDEGKQTEQTKATVKEAKPVKPNPDAKYLAGTVTETDGKVEWTMDVGVPGKSAEQIYNIMLKCLTDLTKTENQLDGSCVALVNKKEHVVVASVKEWLVFKDNFLSLDRAKFFYNIMAYCSDGHLKLKMNRLTYKYEEDRRGNRDSRYTAEEWISDRYALNRKKTKLLPGSAKFRRKTVDRKDYIFGIIRQTVLK